jgi:hypothetical protein
MAQDGGGPGVKALVNICLLYRAVPSRHECIRLTLGHTLVCLFSLWNPHVSEELLIGT